MKKKNLSSIKLVNELTDTILNQYPEKSDIIIARAMEINSELHEANANQTKAELRHTREKIYPAIAFYKAVMEHTSNQTAAYDLIANNFEQWGRKTNKLLRMLCKIPFSYKIVPAIMTKIIHSVYGEDSGFRMVDVQTKNGKCHIDMTKCPYHSNCIKYGCAELGKAFCDADDIAYGNMHDKLYWGRVKTLARGNDVCDFLLEIKKEK